MKTVVIPRIHLPKPGEYVEKEVALRLVAVAQEIVSRGQMAIADGNCPDWLDALMRRADIALKAATAD